MKLMRTLATVFAAVTGLWGQKVESVRPAYVGPGTTLTIRLNDALKATQTVALFVDGKPQEIAGKIAEVKLEEGQREAKFPIPSTVEMDQLFAATREVPISLGPKDGKPWESNAKAMFSPRLKISKIEPPTLSPGEKLTITFTEEAPVSQPLILFVDGAAIPILTLETKKGGMEASWAVGLNE